jgi:hypothetical protein
MLLIASRIMRLASFHRFLVAEAARQCRAISQVSNIVRFSFNDDLGCAGLLPVGGETVAH